MNNIERHVLTKNIEGIRQCRLNGEDINYLNKSGNPALYVHVINNLDGSKKILDELLKFPNIDLNVRNLSFQYTPLFMALYDRKYDIAEYLMEKGADINVKDKIGNNILMSLLLKEDEKGVNFLLSHKQFSKLYINDENMDGNTALFYAIRRDLKAICEKLIEKGADILHESKNGNSVINSLVQNDKLAHFIVDKVDKKDEIDNFCILIDKMSDIYNSEKNDNKFIKLTDSINLIKSIAYSYRLHNNLKEELITKRNVKVLKL